MIRLITSDVDGTLVKGHDDITEVTLKAIQTACASGIKFVICSGRNYYEMKETLLDFYGIEAMAVCENGALIFDEKGTELFCLLLKREDKEKILNITRKYPVFAYSHIRRGVCSYVTYEQYVEYYKEFIKDVTEPDKIVAAERLFNIFAKEVKFGTSIEEILDIDTLKMEMIFVRNDLYKPLWEELSQLDLIVTSAGTSNNIEVTDKNVSKAKTLEVVVKQLGFENDEVAVFGDGLNDLSLFETFKNSFAMDNACKEIKEKARYHTASCNDDGVGKGILKILEDNKNAR